MKSKKQGKMSPSGNMTVLACLMRVPDLLGELRKEGIAIEDQAYIFTCAVFTLLAFMPANQQADALAFMAQHVEGITKVWEKLDA